MYAGYNFHFEVAYSFKVKFLNIFRNIYSRCLGLPILVKRVVFQKFIRFQFCLFHGDTTDICMSIDHPATFQLF